MSVCSGSAALVRRGSSGLDITDLPMLCARSFGGRRRWSSTIALARMYIKTLPYTRGIHLSHLYPQTDTLAIDLLQKMLVFDPTKRISVTEVLQHPYLAGLYDLHQNPPSQVPIVPELDENVDETIIGEMIWQEMLHYQPQATSSIP
ncbi:hypothetical protein QQ045_013714 [Rhodiola kirilowii]